MESRLETDLFKIADAEFVSLEIVLAGTGVALSTDLGGVDSTAGLLELQPILTYVLVYYLQYVERLAGLLACRINPRNVNEDTLTRDGCESRMRAIRLRGEHPMPATSTKA